MEKQPYHYTQTLPISNQIQTIFSRIRRNHGLEHATLHLLAQRHSGRSMAGYSDAGGFWLMGDVPTDDVRAAVNEALRRMRAGERRLAIHPFCGTNFATAGILAAIAAFIALLGAGRSWRSRLERLPMAASLATMALIVAQPLGLMLQENVTTSGEPGDLEVIDVRRSERGGLPAHRIQTKG
jgi:hypothetical protein